MKWGSRAFWRQCAHRLRVTRLALGITEKQMADGFGITLRTYRKWESGGSQSNSPAPCMRFYDAYGVSMDWLLSGRPGNLSPKLTLNVGGKVAILPVESAEHNKWMLVTEISDKLRDKGRAVALPILKEARRHVVVLDKYTPRKSTIVPLRA